MIKVTRATSPGARRVTRRLLFARTRGRLAAFLVLALIAAAAITTLSFAKTAMKPKKSKSDNSLITAGTKSEEPATKKTRQRKTQATEDEISLEASGATAQVSNSKVRGPIELRLSKAHDFKGDLRDLPQTKPEKIERPEREEPESNPSLLIVFVAI